MWAYFKRLRRMKTSCSCSGQIRSSDVSRLADQGYTHVICLRPDAELGAGSEPEMLSRAVAKAAKSAGLTFHYLPVSPAEGPERAAALLADLAARPGARAFAYCRSGARARLARTLAARRSPAVTAAA